MKFASYFEDTLLRPDIVDEDVKQLCKTAKSERFTTVCLPPYFVPAAKTALGRSATKITTVVGYPLGFSPTVAKVEEIKRAIDEGAAEFDVVVNLSAVKNKQWGFVRSDMDRMLTACHLRSKKIKFIFEIGLLSEDEIEKLCEISNELEPDFVCATTGHNGAYTTTEMLVKLRALLKPSIKLKANIESGSITPELLKPYIDAGADRVGAYFEK